MLSGCFHYLVYLLLIIINYSVEAEFIDPPASDFDRHSIVQPIVEHARTKREIISTRDERGLHHSEVTMKIPVDGEEYILDLWLNQHLVSDNHVLRYKKNGNTVIHKPKAEEMDLCHYGGSVRDKPNSWVALSTCHGIQGIVFDGEKMRYIEPAQGGDISSKHYMYDHADLSKSYKCGNVDGITNNSSYEPQTYRKHHDDIQQHRDRYKRYASEVTVRGPYNKNKQSRYVELMLVADHRQYLANRGDVNRVHRQMAILANIINSYYAPLNIFIALVSVEVWTEGDEIPLDENADITLNRFLEYKKTKLVTLRSHDNAHLLTGQSFLESVIGKAPKSGICSSAYSGGIANNHSPVIGLVATTIAHEMGHNFGMDHDTNGLCECPDQKCIMSPSSSSVIPVHWSSCSMHSLVLSFQKGLDYCLRNKPKRLHHIPMCGNGFVEQGEQCDCGTMSVAGAYNPCHKCCEPSTCMLRSNATCGTGMCCDLQTCRPKSAGTMCRTAERECDLPEYCTGHSEYCPEDVFKMDTTPCGKGAQAAYCVRGRCSSHTDQCRLLWGTTGNSSHRDCYSKRNVKGIEYGNCGYDHRGYIACEIEDAMCGTLQCHRLTNHLQYGNQASSSYVKLIYNDKIIECHAAIIDLGFSDVNPGFVPDGAKCGDGMMCRQQKCVSVDAVRQSLAKDKSSVCPSDCSGHGICNSKGHCHCDTGFAPPLCALPGPGGSYESGPASDPKHTKRVMIAMYVIFLGIVPSLVLILCLLYYFRPAAMVRCNAAMKKILIFFNINRHSNIEGFEQENLNPKERKPESQLNVTMTNEPIYANSGDIFKQQKIIKPPRKINIGKIEIVTDDKTGKAFPASNIRKDNDHQMTRKDIVKGNFTNDTENDDSRIYVNHDFLVRSKTTSSKGNEQTTRKKINKNNIEIVRQEIGKGNALISVEGNRKDDIQNDEYVNKDFQLASQLPSKKHYKDDNKISKTYSNKNNNETIRSKVGKRDMITNKNINESDVKGATYFKNDYQLAPKKTIIKKDTAHTYRPNTVKEDNNIIEGKDNKKITECSKYVNKDAIISDKRTHANDSLANNIINIGDIQTAKNKFNKNNLEVTGNRHTEKKPVVSFANNTKPNVKDLISTMNDIAAKNQGSLNHNSDSGSSNKLSRNNVNVHGLKK